MASVTLPFLSALVPNGLSHGAIYLIEFEPQSFWYEASLTIAAEAVNRGIRTDYHAFMRTPNDLREALVRLGLDVPELERKGTLRIIDSYNVATGLGIPENPERSVGRSLNLADWSVSAVRDVKEGGSEEEKERLHIDENTSILLRYNREEAFIDHWRIRTIPWLKALGLIQLTSLLSGAASESFYKQFESFCDGVIDFNSIERGAQIQQYARVRFMRGKPHDSRWHHLRLLDNGSVKADLTSLELPELGIKGWIRGTKR